MKTHTLVAAALLLATAGCGENVEAGPRDALAAGWSVRLDDPEQSPAALRFLQHGDGLEAKPGQNACLWHPDLQATGSYRLTVNVTHLDSGEHPHGAGLIFGGQDVDGARQAYTYFLVRSDRSFLIKKRIGIDTADIVSWTEHEAVAPEDDLGVTKNRLSVEVREDDLRFSINGTEVHRETSEDLSSDGRIGLRLVHDIHVMFGTPLVEPLD